MAELNWTDAQWQRVNDAVTEAFSKASVASAFLPMYGPLIGSVETVRNERLHQDDSLPPTISLDRDFASVNLKLVNLTVKVELSSEQVNDDTLANALLAFRRAANLLALGEDQIVFAGYRRGFDEEDSRLVSSKMTDPQKGLADLPARFKFASIDLPKIRPKDPLLRDGAIGQSVVENVAQAIVNLEGMSNPGPFACILGDNLYKLVHTPSSSLVLPADRITPQLHGGSLLRSGKMASNSGIVVSLAGNAIDIVVGTLPSAQFLQRTPEAKFLFRVHERIVLRIRDKKNMPVSGFRIDPGQKISPDSKTIVEEEEQLIKRAAEGAAPDFKKVVERVRSKAAKAKANLSDDQILEKAAAAVKEAAKKP